MSLVTPSLTRSASTNVASPFDTSVKRLHRAAAAKSPSVAEYAYIREAVAESLVDRLQDVARPFAHAIDVGAADGAFGTALGSRATSWLEDSPLPGVTVETRDVPGQIERLTIVDDVEEMRRLATKNVANALKDVAVVSLDGPFDNLDAFRKAHENAPVDLVVSNLNMHWSNDLRADMKAYADLLRPDGCFLGAMMCGDTLYELRASLAAAEQERDGGVSAHVSPFMPAQDACGLLNSSGLTLSTVDTMDVELEFDTMFDLLRHLQGMGEQNAVKTSRRIGRDVFLAAASIYQSLFPGDERGTIRATFQIVFMIGWKPSHDQPKPLERGDFKVNLKDALAK